MVEVRRSVGRFPIKADTFDADPWTLGVTNGVIELKTGKQREARREDFLTKRSPVEYDQKARCPCFLAFLRNIFDGNQALVDFVQRAAGYTLTGDTREQCLFLLYGTGANGKSTLLNALREVL